MNFSLVQPISNPQETREGPTNGIRGPPQDLQSSKEQRTRYAAESLDIMQPATWDSNSVVSELTMQLWQEAFPEQQRHLRPIIAKAQSTQQPSSHRNVSGHKGIGLTKRCPSPLYMSSDCNVGGHKGIGLTKRCPSPLYASQRRSLQVAGQTLTCWQNTSVFHQNRMFDRASHAHSSRCQGSPCLKVPEVSNQIPLPPKSLDCRRSLFPSSEAVL